MARDAFDIYQTDAGYAAVSNPVQRQILEALREADRQLPDLVTLTGRSKPTLSSLHMKELLARELVEEREHPTDSRRKVYRLKATRIGSSDIPVAQLKDAVQHYVSLAPLKGRVPLRDAAAALLAAPAGTDAKVVWAQARQLALALGPTLKAGSARDLWMRAGGFFEQEGLAKALRIDLERSTLELAPPEGLGGPLLPALLGGFLEGLAKASGLELPPMKATASSGGVRLQAA